MPRDGHTTRDVCDFVGVRQGDLRVVFHTFGYEPNVEFVCIFSENEIVKKGVEKLSVVKKVLCSHW